MSRCCSPRPAKLPQDPVDRYAERAMGVGALAAGAAVPFFRPRRALALGLASTPKAPAAAREGFATYLGRILAKRGVIVMDRGVLRRLGQIDTVVLDERALRTGHTELTDVVPMAGAGADDVLGLSKGQKLLAVVGVSAQHAHGVQAIAAAVLEGRAMWSSVREALAILLGGNLGEIGFNVLAALITGRSPLNARQILLVNLLTDLAPALAIALRPPKADQMESLLHEGPETSLGGQLDRDIMLRALTTTFGASTAWAIARLTGRSRRASTVALAALVGTQLGQTLVTGGLDRRVLGASLGSAAALAAVIQTPGVSGFFGCTPLGPVGWSIAVGATTTATALNALLSKVLRG